MLLLEAYHLNLQVGTRTIFRDLGLSIHAGEKIGLIGHNGSGKSSLLRMLTGIDANPEAIIRTSNQLVLEYLPQNQSIIETATVMEQVFNGDTPLFDTVRQYENALQEAEKHPSDAKPQEQLFFWQEEMERLDAWQLESNARSILHRLGIDDVMQKMQTLSGGMQKRVALATTLVRPANLLLLDEPTNHLDYTTIAWLEKELAERQCALLLVTHDRYFLDRICNNILELDQGKLYHHQGNYSDFMAKKSERLAHENRKNEKMQRLYKQELAWMRKGVEARRTKQKARQERFYELKERLNSSDDSSLDIDFKTARLGRKIIDIDNLGKTFGKRQLFKNFTYAFVKNDRIGVIGKNGSGKSTLLNVLAGLDDDVTGSIAWGETIRIGYYRQSNQTLPFNETVLGFIRSIGDSITRADGTRASATQMLDAFLFRPNQLNDVISSLSGGEQRRLYLLSILMQDINVLFLDEPTNDLDIGTLQVLEDYLQHFPGPVIAVSHDRYFLDRICQKLFVITPQGDIRLHHGDFSDYLETQIAPELPPKQKSPKKSHTKSPSLKLSWQEEKDYATIEDDIAGLEEAVVELEAAMATHASDFSKLLQLQEELASATSALEEKYQRWEELEEKRERIQQERSYSDG